MRDNVIIFTVPGKPFGKQRPRFTSFGKFGKAYTPKETVAYETQIKERFAAEFPDHVPYTGPVEMLVTAYFPIPVSTSKKKREQMLDGDILYTKSPDWDNIGKIFGDALNQIAYVDDRQIVTATVTKEYSDHPRVRVSIESV